MRNCANVSLLWIWIFGIALALLCFYFVAPSDAFKLPDTGQTTCYDQVGNVISCPAPGEPLAQDGSYNMNPLTYTDNGNGTVTDTNTDLMWQKEDDGSTYNWYQASGTFDATYNPSSQSVCGSLTLGGYSDWRLPAEKELMTIVDYGIPYPGPTIDTTYFSNTKSADYWSSTTYADPAYKGAWSVAFYRGSVDGGIYKDGYYYVRCVRGEQITGPNLIDNGDGTVTDNKTSLIWQQGEQGFMTWDSSLSYCEGLSLGGHSDWRLPNIKELKSITDDTRWNPAIDPAYFPNASVWGYWSSTTHAGYPYGAWFVDFDGGRIYGYCNKGGYGCFVRCVSGGQTANQGTIKGENFNFSNVNTSSDYLYLWVDFTVDSQPASGLCNSYTFKIVGDNGKGASQTSENGCEAQNGANRYKIVFQVDKDSQYPRAAYFENAKIYACQIGNSGNCSQIDNTPSGLSFYGTTFDVTKHAYKFSNGAWNGSGKPVDWWIRQNDFYKIGSVITDYIESDKRKAFWESFGKDVFFYQVGIDGGCYGLTNSAISNFTHAGEDAWGTGSISDWTNEINNHWGSSTAVNPYKPFNTDDIYGSNETYDSDTKWTTQSAKKIMYYHVAYVGWRGDNWVGKDRLSPTIDEQNEIDIRNILRKGSPVSSTFVVDRVNGKVLEGAHTIAITHLITWDNHTKYMIWDNNNPYWKTQNRHYGPYLEWYVDNNTSYIESYVHGDQYIKVVNQDDGNGSTDYGYHFLRFKYAPYYLLPNCSDSQNIYNLWGSLCSEMKSAQSSMALEQTEDTVAYPYPEHIEVSIIGGKVNGVYDKGTGKAITLVPNGEIISGQAVIESTNNGIYNFLYLPVDKTFKVVATKYAQFVGLKVFVTVPKTDGTVDVLNYENVQTGENDATNIYFYVGRDNKDTKIRRKIGSHNDTYQPDHASTLNTTIEPPQFFNGYHEIDGSSVIKLSWKNSSHPDVISVKIVRKEGGFPISPDDGIVVYQGLNETTVDGSVTYGNTYYYAAYSIDKLSNYSNPIFLSIDTNLNSVYGNVTLSGSQGLQGVLLSLENSEGKVIMTASSDSDGFYVLSNIKSGDYILEASHPSSEIQNFQRNFSLNGQNRQEDFVAVPKKTILLVSDYDEVNVNTSVAFQWTYRNIKNSETVKVALNRGNGWEIIAKAVPILQGQIIWKVNSTTAYPQNAIVRVSLSSDASIYDEDSFTIVPTYIKLISPDGGESWQAGTTQTISWSYAGNPGGNVKIQLYRAGVLNRTIIKSTPIGSSGSGSYDWTIPVNQAPGKDYKVKVTSTTNSSYKDTSNGNFTIVAPLVVSSPNGGENWQAGTTQTISWSYAGNPGGNVKIQLYKAGVLSKTITPSTPIGSSGSGSYDWPIPLNQPPGKDYKIKVTSITNSSYKDSSNGNFTIVAPLIVSSPNGGESWKRGTVQKISWTYTGDPGGNVKIELYKAGVLNKTIIKNTSIGSSENGSYDWTIPVNQALGKDYKIKVTSLTNGAYKDSSDGNFTISQQ